MHHSTKMFLVAASLCLLVSAEPPKPTLPVIEVHSSSSVLSSPTPKPASGPIELTPIAGQKPEKLSGRGRYYSPYGVPAGPGRGWPDAAPPGASGPAGGIMTPR